MPFDAMIMSLAVVAVFCGLCSRARLGWFPDRSLTDGDAPHRRRSSDAV